MGRVVDKEGMAVMRASVTLTMAGDSAFRRQTVAEDVYKRQFIT